MMEIVVAKIRIADWSKNKVLLIADIVEKRRGSSIALVFFCGIFIIEVGPPYCLFLRSIIFMEVDLLGVIGKKLTFPSSRAIAAQISSLLKNGCNFIVHFGFHNLVMLLLFLSE
jgi:hypothetical protein